MTKLAPQPVVYRGTVSGLRISAVDGAAFVDNLPSAVTDLVAADPGIYLFEAYDSSSRLLRGVLGSVGSGETTEANPLNPFDFTSGWTKKTETTIVDANTFTSGATTSWVNKLGQLTLSALYKSNLVATASAGALSMQDFNQLCTLALAGGAERYTTIPPGGSTALLLYNLNATGSTVDVTSISLLRILTPSAQGATIVSAKGGATQSFSYKDASFTFNQSQNIVLVRKLRGRALNLSGTTTGIRFSAIEDTAFLDNLPAGVLPYADGKHYIKIFDSAGKYVEGVLKAVGSGETLDSELVVNGDFSGAWAGNLPEGNSLTGTTTAGSYLTADDANNRLGITSDGSIIGIVQTVAQNLGLQKAVVNLHGVTSGRIKFTSSPFEKYIETVGNNTIYFVSSGTSYGLARYAACNIVVQSWSVKQVLTPSASGATIVNAISGTTYRFLTKETGFNFNDTGTFSYQIWSE